MRFFIVCTAWSASFQDVNSEADMHGIGTQDTAQFDVNAKAQVVRWHRVEEQAKERVKEEMDDDGVKKATRRSHVSRFVRSHGDIEDTQVDDIMDLDTINSTKGVSLMEEEAGMRDYEFSEILLPRNKKAEVQKGEYGYSETRMTKCGREVTVRHVTPTTILELAGITKIDNVYAYDYVIRNFVDVVNREVNLFYMMKANDGESDGEEEESFPHPYDFPQIISEHKKSHSEVDIFQELTTPLQKTSVQQTIQLAPLVLHTVFRALDQLHSRGYVHGDVSPETIQLDEKCQGYTGAPPPKRKRVKVGVTGEGPKPCRIVLGMNNLMCEAHVGFLKNVKSSGGLYSEFYEAPNGRLQCTSKGGTSWLQPRELLFKPIKGGHLSYEGESYYTRHMNNWPGADLYSLGMSIFNQLMKEPGTTFWFESNKYDFGALGNGEANIKKWEKLSAADLYHRQREVNSIVHHYTFSGRWFKNLWTEIRKAPHAPEIDLDLIEILDILLDQQLETRWASKAEVGKMIEIYYQKSEFSKVPAGEVELDPCPSFYDYCRDVERTCGIGPVPERPTDELFEGLTCAPDYSGCPKMEIVLKSALYAEVKGSETMKAATNVEPKEGDTYLRIVWKDGSKFSPPGKMSRTTIKDATREFVPTDSFRVDICKRKPYTFSGRCGVLDTKEFNYHDCEKNLWEYKLIEMCKIATTLNEGWQIELQFSFD